MELHLSSRGCYLHVRDEMFEVIVKDGAESRKHSFAAANLRAIVLAEAGSLSTDALRLAIRHNVDILLLDSGGQPLGRFWHSRIGSTTRIRKAQLAASLDERGMAAVKAWLVQKMENQRDFLASLKKHRPQHGDFLDDKTRRIEALALSAQSVGGSLAAGAADTLRGLEGTAGRLYFEALSHVLPPEWKFEGRSMRPARDAFNAFLNYAYGILYARVEKALIVAGLDPALGYLHRDDYQHLSFSYDFIEPYRIYAETCVFRLFSAKKVNKSHLDPLPAGCKLNAEGKKLLVEAFRGLLEDEKFRYRGKNRSRDNAIRYDAHAYAQSLIGENREFSIEIL